MIKISRITLYTLICFITYSCANKASGPTGGPKDTIPPVIIKSVPNNLELNYKRKDIHITFNENINVLKANENVLVSPPQLIPPEVKGIGKTVTVSFDKDLIDSTTYTINFGNSICDLNENNPLKDFRISFSTGNEIDTLKISGIVLNAENLSPQKNTIVGIQKVNEIDLFTQKPLLRIAKTNEQGEFTIDNVKAGSYKLYALGDKNSDFFLQPGEGLAFSDSLVTPSARITLTNDTLKNKANTSDSIIQRTSTQFFPENILMRFFVEDKKRQYLVKTERKQANSFNLFFNAPQKSLPKIEPLNFEWQGKYIIQKNPTLDSLTYWITDSMVYKVDTLQMTVSYLKTDSAYNYEPTTDTINAVMRKLVVNVKAKKQKEENQFAEPYKFSSNLGAKFDIYKSIRFQFESPLAQIDSSKIKLYIKVDTVFKPILPQYLNSDSSSVTLNLMYNWKPEASYKIEVDSAAFTNIYEQKSDNYDMKFTINSLDEYSSIKLLLAKFDSLVVFQLLDTKDVVQSTKKALPKGTKFEYLKPTDYYIRAFIDRNRNGKWDSGDYTKALQPEEVYYYSKKLTLRANWEFEETWDLESVPVLNQKPKELIVKQ